tara:strand:+ start:280 stop:840 length:561 start_codon:yes stop_codon:yes gene_type:complete
MGFKLSDGTVLPNNAPFTIGTGEDAVNYPANWLRLSTADEKAALGISEFSDPIKYDSRFYQTDGTPRVLDDVNTVNGETGELIKNKDGTQHVTYGLKTELKNQNKQMAQARLQKYDWYITRKAEKGTAIPAAITTYRDAVRTACNTREAEIDACSDAAALATLYSFKEDGTANMTSFPLDPNIQYR